MEDLKHKNHSCLSTAGRLSLPFNRAARQHLMQNQLVPDQVLGCNSLEVVSTSVHAKLLSALPRASAL